MPFANLNEITNSTYHKLLQILPLLVFVESLQHLTGLSLLHHRGLSPTPTKYIDYRGYKNEKKCLFLGFGLPLNDLLWVVFQDHTLCNRLRPPRSRKGPMFLLN